MAITLTSSPADITFAGNSISYLLTSSSTADVLEIGVELWLEDVLDSGTYTKKFGGTAPVDASKQTRWELSDIISKHLKHTLPSIAATTVQAVTSGVRRWYIKTFEVEDGVATSPTTQATKTSLLGGRSRAAIGTALPADYLFMSTRPLVRELNVNQADWLYILPTAGGSSNLVATLHYTDGTTGTKNISLGSYTAYRPIYVPIGYNVQNYAAVNAAKKIRKIVFRIGTGEQIHAVVVNRPSIFARTIAYGNSLGGVDVLYATGKSEQSQDMETLLAEVDAVTPVMVPYGQVANDMVMVRSGVKLPGDIQALKDMRAINSIGLLNGAAWLPMYTEAGSWSWQRDGDFMNAAEFVLKVAYMERHYDRA